MLTLTCTANAGVLLTLDGKRILLDGVCREVAPYVATPQRIRAELSHNFPDIVAVTHRHDDHCDPDFEAAFVAATGRPLIDPGWDRGVLHFGEISVTAVPSRHIGKCDIAHCSYIIEGSSCVWFMGDASPEQFRKMTHLPKPDLIIAPYAYASTDFSLRITRSFGAKNIVLLHLPDRASDPYGLWDSVLKTVGDEGGIFIPKVEEFINFST
jgi:L-ascorbate metabolism protein UlaG (beta-lactamase superfamily)